MATKEQIEGIARVFDTLTASAAIGVTVGVSGHNLLSIKEIIALCCACPILLGLSWLIRSPKL